MPRISPLLTYADVLDLLFEYAQGHGAPASNANARRAVEAAYDEIGSAHEWSFLERNGRVVVNARQTTGSCAYDHATRTVTLTGATNPSWIDDASIRLGDNDVVCDVADGTSGGATFTLDTMMNPGQDVASGSDYVLYERYVRLPSDFRRFTVPMSEGSWRLGDRVTMTELLALDRYQSASADEITHYAIAEVPDLYDQKALFVYPQQTTTKTVDFIYARHPRVLRYTGHDSAESQVTVSVTSGAATLTGVGTAFASDMVGAIVRLGTDATNRPTGRFGGHPYGEERSISAVSDTTNATLDNNVATTRSGVKYLVTDPIDIGRIAKNAFLRCAEKHLLLTLPIDNSRGQKSSLLKLASQLAEDTLLKAMGADNSTYYDSLGQGAGGGSYPYTIGDDD